MRSILDKLAPYAQQMLILAVFWYATTMFCLDRLRRKMRSKLHQETIRREAAEAANRVKMEFLTSASHEIRGPLNAIVTLTNAALGSPITPELRDCLNTLRFSTDWLRHTADEVLDFARLGANSLQLSTSPFSLREILRSACSVAQMPAGAQKLIFRIHIDSALPDCLIGDGARLRQIVFNLVENAMQFTFSGSVLVIAVLERRDPHTVTVRISVADTGIGMKSKNLQHLFDPLSEPVHSPHRRSGFGLPICQRLISLMGGTLHVQSQLGLGSNFTFTLSFLTRQESADLHSPSTLWVSGCTDSGDVAMNCAAAVSLAPEALEEAAA